LAAAIKAKLGVDVQTVPGDRGAFEVVRDGQLIFSKLKLGRFPSTDAEVVDLLGAK
jgi:selT/selW/selH-like putative selenoprotein